MKKEHLEEAIRVRGAKVHNLKDVDVTIPHNQLVVVTGVSGSGKSSLTIDTIYAEGQRRYVESLSSYARQFMGRMNKPEVESIKGIAPAIAIEQKVSTRSSRSTVGSLTEIYDYLRVFYARLGRTYSPISGEEVRKHEVSDVVDKINSLDEGTKLLLSVPLKRYKGRNLKQELELTLQKGFTRLLSSGETINIEDLLEDEKQLKSFDSDELEVLIDRFVVRDDEENQHRIADSTNIAFYEGEGTLFIGEPDGDKWEFNNRFELDGMRFEEPNPQFFNFNNPYGACKHCEGFGTVLGIDDELVIPDKKLSVYENAIAPWKGEKMKRWKQKLVKVADEIGFPIHKPIKDLTKDEYELLWSGNKQFKGLNAFFKYLEEKSYKIQYRVMLSRYRGRTLCPECHGTRLRKDVQYVRIADKNIVDLVLLPITELKEFFEGIKLTKLDMKIADRVVKEVKMRLQFMVDVGLGYLTLNRYSNTLSGGETQRINLTRTLGSNLTSSLYILDEPSIGLHPRDTDRLVKVLKHLRDLGNTVLVVEHEEDIIRNSDYLVDMGPFAGVHGGEVVYQGNYQKVFEHKESLTAKYLAGEMEIPVPKKRRKPKGFIELNGASEHNLKSIDVKFPLGVLSVITGVSGSGKTTLVKKILVPAMKRFIEGYGERPGTYDSLGGDIMKVGQIVMVDQNPIGKSSRSNPVTYIKAYDAIRDLYANQQASKVNGFKPKHFSFNVDGGRCDNCKGEGEIVVEMQFLADVHLVCEDCGGKRFKEEVLDIRYKEKSIYDVLELSIDEAMDFFVDAPEIQTRLQPLQDVGLGYIKLGQSSSTLSGGEAQRVKLASFLAKGTNKGEKPYLFIFDEPTTGLHFHDINKLLMAFNALIDRGHTIVVIEHNMEVIKTSDWLIDLGPEGGEEGGYLVYQGVPEDMIDKSDSYTGQYLKEKLQRK